MHEPYAGALERVLADGLEPVRAPASLWYRVDAELTGRQPAAHPSISRLALAFGIVVMAVVSVGWYLERPASTGAPSNRPAQIVRGEHSCVLCHV